MSDEVKIMRPDDFKGQQRLKDIYKGFIGCPDCMGMYHLQDPSDLSRYCLPEKVKKEALTFVKYRWNGNLYFLNEKSMINYAKYKGWVD